MIQIINVISICCRQWNCQMLIFSEHKDTHHKDTHQLELNNKQHQKV